MVGIDLSGRVALVVGVANKHSIAWAIAQKLAEAGCQKMKDLKSRLKN